VTSTEGEAKGGSRVVDILIVASTECEGKGGYRAEDIFLCGLYRG
jgi:hypothetical protein